MAAVELRGLTKRYGALAVVDDISLKIEHGRLVCLLGPSGCGKTTTLRLIAGFVEPTAGEILVGDQVISSPARTLPPERRNMSMIFQSYALWPHMTVAENVAYGLQLRKIEQAGSPEDIYDRPRSEFVARFIGSSNVVKGKVLDDSHIECAGSTLRCTGGKFAAGGEGAVAIRQHVIRLWSKKPDSLDNVMA